MPTVNGSAGTPTVGGIRLLEADDDHRVIRYGPDLREVPVRAKRVGETLDFTLDVAPALGTDTISAAAVATTGGTIGTGANGAPAPTFTNTTVKYFIFAGSASGRYTVTVTITTAGGQTLKVQMIVEVIADAPASSVRLVQKKASEAFDVGFSFGRRVAASDTVNSVVFTIDAALTGANALYSNALRRAGLRLSGGSAATTYQPYATITLASGVILIEPLNLSVVAD